MAVPDVSIVTVAKAVFEFLNVTLPVGTDEEELTLAVKVIFCPNTDGLTDEAKVVVEGETAVPPRDTVRTLVVLL